MVSGSETDEKEKEDRTKRFSEIRDEFQFFYLPIYNLFGAGRSSGA